MRGRDFTISAEEKLILLEAHRACVGKRDADKIKVIILFSEGWKVQQIEKALLLDERTILRIKKLFRKKGIDGLIANNYRGGSAKLSNAQTEKLTKALDTHLFANAAEVCAFVKKEFRVRYTPEGMVQTLHRLGYSYKKTKAVPGKSDSEKQEEFVDAYEDITENLGKTEKIYFSDAVHPTHNMMPAYAWSKKGEERGVKTNTGRQRVNVLGFYSPCDQEIVVDTFETINAQAVIAMFRKIEHKHPELTKIIVIVDNAKYNYCSLVREYLATSRIQVVNLPSYSPNLNLIERLWKLMKKRVIYNQYYERFEDFREAVLSFFRQRSAVFRNELQTLLAENFHIIHCPSG